MTIQNEAEAEQVITQLPQLLNLNGIPVQRDVLLTPPESNDAGDTGAQIMRH